MLHSLFNGNFFTGVRDGCEDDTSVRAITELLDKRVAVHYVSMMSASAADKTMTMTVTSTQQSCCVSVDCRLTARLLPSTQRAHFGMSFKLERCNPWPHVANCHMSISHLLSSCCHLFTVSNSGLLSVQRPRPASHADLTP